MKFFKILKYDLKNGIIRRWPSYIVAVIMGITFFSHMKMMADSLETSHIDLEKATVMNYLFYLVKGMEKYIPSPDNPFEFPVVWMIIFAYGLFLTLQYPFQDMSTCGQQVLIRVGNKGNWWLGKCIWNIVSLVCYFFVLYGTIIVLCKCSGINITLGYSNNVNETIFGITSNQQIQPKQLLLLVFLLPVFVAICMSIFQMCIGLFIKPIYSFVITMAILVLSAYYQSPWCIGNYAMIMRSEILVPDGMSSLWGIIMCFVFTFTFACVGYNYFKKYDILNVE